MSKTMKCRLLFFLALHHLFSPRSLVLATLEVSLHRTNVRLPRPNVRVPAPFWQRRAVDDVPPAPTTAARTLELECAASVASSAAAILYGSALLAYGRLAPGQILIITVMRATGYAELERAAAELKRNVFQAIASALRHAPSLVLLAKTIRELDDRKAMHREILRRTREARRDGVVTRREANRIASMQRKQIRLFNRDIRRLKRGSSSLRRVWDTLDLREIASVFRDLFFVMFAVLASGNANSVVGTAVCRYCQFANLGSSFLEVNRKIGFPIAHVIVRRTPFFPEDAEDEELDEGQLSFLRGVGAIVVYGLSAFFILFQRDLATRLNGAMIAASIVMRGLSSLVRSNEEVEDVEGKGEGTTAERLKGFWGGILTIILAIAAVLFGKLVDKEAITAPDWLTPLFVAERAVDKLVALADRAI